MTIFDGIVMLIGVICLIRSIWTGFVREIASIAALFLGYWSASTYYPLLAPVLDPFINNPQLKFLTACIVLFGATYLIVILIGVMLKKVITFSLLGWFDRAMGAVFGLAKAALISSLLFLFLGSFLSGTNPFLRQSLSYPYLLHSSRFLLQLITDQDLRARFLPKDPVIQKPPSLPDKKQPASETHPISP